MTFEFRIYIVFADAYLGGQQAVTWISQTVGDVMRAKSGRALDPQASVLQRARQRIALQDKDEERAYICIYVHVYTYI